MNTPMKSVLYHNLKTHPEPWRAVRDGTKTAEFRRDDRGFSVGDHLRLTYHDPDSPEDLDYPRIEVKVTHIQRGFGIPEGYVMLSIQRLTR